MRRFLLNGLTACVLIPLTAPPAVAVCYDDVDRVIPRDVFEAAGLHRLSPHELAQLCRWVGTLPRQGGHSPSSLHLARPVPKTVADLNQYVGAVLMGHDGVSLGALLPKHDSQSIANRFGDHSRLSGRSIFSNLSEYGSRLSDLSVNNLRAQHPPTLVFQGQVVGTITVNRDFPNRIDPQIFSRWADDFDRIF